MNDEIKAGEWAAVVSVEDGIVGVLRVDRIFTEEDQRPIAETSDFRTWLADTGEALMRDRRGLKIRPIEAWEARNKIRDILTAIDGDTTEGRDRIMRALAGLL